MSANTSPFFSICIPVYNAEKYLAECLESVLKQSETDYEIVLVDDGSKDNSGKICDEYAARYPDVIRVLHNENAGPLIARHEAILHARGRFLAFLDSDDFYYPDALQKIKNVIESRRVDMVFFDWSRVFINGDARWESQTDFEDGEVFEGESKNRLYATLIAKTSLNSLCSKCFRRELYDDETDYRTKWGALKQCEDKLVLFPCIDRAKRVTYLKETLYGYRVNEQSTTRNFTLKNYKDCQAVRVREEEYVKRWNLPQSVVKKQKVRWLGAGIECATSLAYKTIYKQTDYAVLADATRYIAEDEQFRDAFVIGGTELSRLQRTICKLILKRNAKGLLMLFRTMIALSALKRLFRCVKR